MLQEFKIKTTNDYSKVRGMIEDIIRDLEAKLHRDSYLTFSNPWRVWVGGSSQSA